jgi:hypothetical protein
MIPTYLAIDSAVSGWSPVNINTLIPALLQSSTAYITPFLGGSIIAIKPTNVNPSNGKFIYLAEYSTFSFGIFILPSPNTLYPYLPKLS